MMWDFGRVMWQGGKGERPRRESLGGCRGGSWLQAGGWLLAPLPHGSRDLGIDFLCAGKGYQDPLWQGIEVHASSKKQTGN